MAKPRNELLFNNCFQYKINMQRCPYIHEMKERLLGEQQPLEQVQPSKKPTTPPPAKMDQPQLPVATVVKVSLRFTSLKLGLFGLTAVTILTLCQGNFVTFVK